MSLRLESAIVAGIVSMVKDMRKEGVPVHILKVHGNAMQRKGEPDLIACIGGRMVAMEVKRPGRKPTAIQVARLESWKKAGAHSCVVHSEREANESLMGAYRQTFV